MKKIIFFAIMMIAFAVNAQNYAQIPVVTTTTTVDTVYQDIAQPTPEYKSDDLIIAEAQQAAVEKNNAILLTTIKEGQKAIAKVKYSIAIKNAIIYPLFFLVFLTLWFISRAKIKKNSPEESKTTITVFLVSTAFVSISLLCILIGAAETITTILNSDAVAFGDSFKSIINALK